MILRNTTWTQMDHMSSLRKNFRSCQSVACSLALSLFPSLVFSFQLSSKESNKLFNASQPKAINFLWPFSVSCNFQRQNQRSSRSDKNENPFVYQVKRWMHIAYISICSFSSGFWLHVALCMHTYTHSHTHADRSKWKFQWTRELGLLTTITSFIKRLVLRARATTLNHGAIRRENKVCGTQNIDLWPGTGLAWSRLGLTHSPKCIQSIKRIVLVRFDNFLSANVFGKSVYRIRNICHNHHRRLRRRHA